MHIRPHEKLIVWQEAYKLSLSIYTVTRTFPRSEEFGLISQLRRAASSVPINLAEGNAKHTKKEKRKYFRIASASLEEVHCCLRLSTDLGYVERAVFISMDDWIQRVSTMLYRLCAAQ